MMRGSVESSRCSGSVIRTFCSVEIISASSLFWVPHPVLPLTFQPVMVQLWHFKGVNAQFYKPLCLEGVGFWAHPKWWWQEGLTVAIPVRYTHGPTSTCFLVYQFPGSQLIFNAYFILCSNIKKLPEPSCSLTYISLISREYVNIFWYYSGVYMHGC